MVFNTTTQVDPAVSIYYDRILLLRGLPYMVHDKFADTRPFKQKSGDTMKFRRYNSLPVATTPLVEMVLPPGLMISKTDITCSLRQYGAWIPYSDLVDLLNQDPVLTELAELLGEQRGQSLDIVYRDIFVAGTNVYYAGSYADSAIDTRIEIMTAPTLADFKAIREGLIGNKAQMIAPMIKASGNVGTMPVAPAFYGIISHELQHDIEACDDFLPVYQYPSSVGSFPSEIGALPEANIRFLITQAGKVWRDASTGATAVAGTTYRGTNGTGADVFACLVFAKHCCAVVPLDGGNLKNIVKSIDSGGVENALNQKGSTGWKAITTGCITNDLNMVRGEFLATL